MASAAGFASGKRASTSLADIPATSDAMAKSAWPLIRAVQWANSTSGISPKTSERAPSAVTVVSTAYGVSPVWISKPLRDGAIDFGREIACPSVSSSVDPGPTKPPYFATVADAAPGSHPWRATISILAISIGDRSGYGGPFAVGRRPASASRCTKFVNRVSRTPRRRDNKSTMRDFFALRFLHSENYGIDGRKRTQRLAAPSFSEQRSRGKNCPYKAIRNWQACERTCRVGRTTICRARSPVGAAAWA